MDNNNKNLESIEIIHSRYGARNRNKLSNANNPDDLKQDLMMAVAAFRDYKHYKMVLNGIDEDFDESLEHFDIETWINLTRSPDKVDDLAMNCLYTLSEAMNAFSEIANRAEENCAAIIKTVLSAPPKTQKFVLGCEYPVSPEEMEEQIEEIFTMLDECEYEQSIPDNFNTFLSVIKELPSEKVYLFGW